MRHLGVFDVFRFFALLFIAGALSFGAWVVWGQVHESQQGQGGGGRDGGRPTYVIAAPATEAEFSVRIDAVGTAKARESITVTAKSQDTISAINFRDGDLVRQGDVILEMTSREQSADLSAARSSFAEAQKQFDRTKALADKGLAAAALLDERRASLDAAAARVKAQESQVSDRLIRAPFSGVLGLRQVSVGALVRPGDVITTLDDVSTIKLDLAIAETSIAFLKAGLPIEVRAAGYPEKLLTGSVTGVDSRVDPQSRTIAIRAEVDNPDGLLKPGMLLSATLRADPRRSVAVSEAAIVPLGPDRFVYIAGADGKAERRAVKTGRRSLGQVEILSGLRPGESVIVDGIVKLRPGAPITLTPPRERRQPGAQRPGSARGSSNSALL